MRQKMAFLLSVLLICMSIMPAYAVMDQEGFYKMGISALKDMTSAQAQQAVNYFDKAGNHLEAKNYKQYAQSLFEILQLEEGEKPDLEMTGYRLQKLAGKQNFTESLSENGFPSCEGLIIYIEAWILESSEDYAGAWHLYEQIEDVLDAYDREFDLTGKAYEQGKAAYDSGDYAAAAEALKGLEWRDSDGMYKSALEKLRPTPTAAPTPMPTQKPTPTSDPTPLPTAKPMEKPSTTDGFELAWNAQDRKWDVYCCGILISSDPAELIDTVAVCFGLSWVSSENGDCYLGNEPFEHVDGLFLEGIPFDTMWAYYTEDSHYNGCQGRLQFVWNSEEVEVVNSIWELHSAYTADYTFSGSYYVDGNSYDLTEEELEMCLASFDLPYDFNLYYYSEDMDDMGNYLNIHCVPSSGYMNLTVSLGSFPSTTDDFDIAWNAEKEKCDIYMNGNVLPSEPEKLAEYLSAHFDSPWGKDEDGLCWWSSPVETEIHFKGISFEKAELERWSGTQKYYALGFSSNADLTAETSFIQVNKELMKSYWCMVAITGNSFWREYFYPDLDQAVEEMALRLNDEDQLFIHYYYDSFEDKIITVTYCKFDSGDYFNVSIPFGDYY